MSTAIKKSKIISSMVWKLLERSGAQGVQFVVQIVLARLLMPADYGMIALVTIFITLANVFVQSGFNRALVQKKDSDDHDFSSIFFLSLFIAIVLYVLLFFAAPFVAVFYEQPDFTRVLRVLSFTLFFGAVNSLQNAYITKNMLFKKHFISSLFAMVISGAIGISTAYLGWRVWALVTQQLVQQLAICLILWFTVRWRPHLYFSLERTKKLFSFGWKILVSSLLNTLYLDLRSLIIGKIYTPDMLGFFNRGQQFPKLITVNIDGSIKTVMLPAYAQYQDDIKRVKSMVRRSIVTSSFLMFPLMIGLAVIARPLVLLLLTDKWLPAVPFLQIFCFSYALTPIHSANLQAINALGRSDIFLKLEVIKKVIGLGILLVSIPFGIYAIALGMVLSGLIATFINAFPNKKLLDYHYKEQWQDIMPSLLIALAMGAAVFSLNWLSLPAWLLLIIQICAGAALYYGLARVFKLESLSYMLTTLQELFAVVKKRRQPENGKG
jgi:O-antigen/teichoic acid export membrane protein